MADGTDLNLGSGGDTIATDDVTDLGVANGQKVQRIKVGFGADNAYTDVESVSTNPLPVALSATDNAVLDSIDSSLSGTLTVGSHAVTNAGTFAVQISDTSFAVADGNALGEGVLIQGDDGTDRKNINVDATTGDVQVDVTNTVTVDLGANNDVTLATLPDTASGDLAAINSAVSGTLTVGAHAVTNAGTFAVQEDGAALTALQLIDDCIFADDAAFTLASSKVAVMGAIRDDALTTLTAVEGDAVPLRVSSTGALHVTGAGGGTQYNVDDAGPTVVTMAGVVRDDSLTTLTEVDGDATLLRVNSTGALHVTGGGGGTEYTEDVATANPIVGTATLMERDDALTTVTPIEGDWIGLRGSAEGALWTQDFNSDAILTDTNTLAGAVSGGQMQVDIVADGAGLLTTAAHDAAFGTAGSADTQVRTVQGIASMTPLLVDATGQGDVPVTLSGETVVLGAGTAAFGKLAANSGVDIGDVDVTSISAGSNLIGDVGISGARTSGGTTIFRSLDLDETEEQIKATSGQIYWIHAMNLTAATLFLKIYNATAATVVVGTTTPVLTFPIATQGDTNGAGFTLSIPNGIAFGTAITAAVTTGVADNDTTGPAANGCVVNIGYA